MIAGEFQTGARMIYQELYEQALSRLQNNETVVEPTACGITTFSLSLYDTGNEQKMSVDFSEFVDLRDIQGISIVRELFGDVDGVEWVVHRRFESDRHHWNFAIGGQALDGQGGF